jgi:hypothetical protein
VSAQKKRAAAINLLRTFHRTKEIQNDSNSPQF